jgi:nucleoside-diphosphate-sugar epimerase
MKVLGIRAEVSSDQRRERPARSEVRELLSSPGLARELLGWEPRVGLEAGLRLTGDWVAAHLNVYAPDSYLV